MIGVYKCFFGFLFVFVQDLFDEIEVFDFGVYDVGFWEDVYIEFGF